MHKILNLCLTLGLLGGAVAVVQADTGTAPMSKAQSATVSASVMPCDPLIAGCAKAYEHKQLRGVQIPVAMHSGELDDPGLGHQPGGDNSIYPEG